MKKTTLLILPLVAFMASCSNQQPATGGAKLPSGGSAISSKEDNRANYNTALSDLAGGVFGTVAQNLIHLDASLDVKIKGIEGGDNAKMDMSIGADIDIYIAVGDGVSSYTSAMIDVSKLNVNVTNIPQVGKVTVSDAEIKAYYEVVQVEEAYEPVVFLDLSNQKLINGVASILSTVFGAQMTDEQIMLMLQQMLGTNYKGYIRLTQVAELDQASLPDVLGSYIAMAKMMGAALSSMVPDLIAQLKVLPLLKEWKDANGEVERLGLELNQDFKDEYNEFVQTQATDGEGNPREVNPEEKAKKFQVGIALVAGSTNGSYGFALESLVAKVNVVMGNNASVNANLSIEGSYNTEVTYNRISTTELSAFTMDYGMIIGNLIPSGVR